MRRLLTALLCLLPLAWGLSLGAQTRDESLEGRWYLRFDYEATPRSAARNILATEEWAGEVYSGGYFSIVTSYAPVELDLQSNGIALLRIGKEEDVRSFNASAEIVQRSIFRTYWTVELAWSRGKDKDLRFKLLKGRDKFSPFAYRVSLREESEELVGDWDSHSLVSDDMLVEGLEFISPVTNKELEHLVDKLNKMRLERWSIDSFTLNGSKSVSKPSGGAEERFWSANMIQASRDPRQAQNECALATIEYRLMAAKAAQALAEHYMGKIAPWSGRNASFSLDTETAELTQKGQAVMTATLSFEARDLFRSVPYGTCEVVGRLTILAPSATGSLWHARFTMERRNEHARAVSSESDWDELKALGPFELQ